MSPHGFTSPNQVAPAKHRVNAGHLRRRRHVDGDVGVRVRATQDLGVKHAREANVVDENAQCRSAVAGPRPAARPGRSRGRSCRFPCPVARPTSWSCRGAAHCLPHHSLAALVRRRRNLLSVEAAALGSRHDEVIVTAHQNDDCQPRAPGPSSSAVSAARRHHRSEKARRKLRSGRRTLIAAAAQASGCDAFAGRRWR